MKIIKRIAEEYAWYGIKIYKVWNNMKQRSMNKNHRDYENWGGKGIVVCERWMNFDNFLEDTLMSFIEHCKEKGLTNTQLDRTDNNGNYCPENCKWVTRKENNRNRSNNNVVEIKGVKKTMVEWAEHYGMSANGIKYRIKNNLV